MRCPECKQTNTTHAETIVVKDHEILCRVYHCNVCKHKFEIKPRYVAAIRCSKCNLPLMNISAFSNVDIDATAKCVKCPIK